MKQAVAILVLRGDENALCVTNRRYGGFCLPGGKVERGETLEDAAIRELREETGILVCPEQLIPIFTDKSAAAEDWVCTTFLCITDQDGRQVEEGTEVMWKLVTELATESIYSDYYIALFDWFDG